VIFIIWVMASITRTNSSANRDTIDRPEIPVAHGLDRTNLDEKHRNIETAEQGGEIGQATTVPAIVDIHGDVVKADWHAIRTQANEAEVYEHSLGLWEAMRTYKKVRRCPSLFTSWY
jgi:hypothetical protein